MCKGTVIIVQQHDDTESGDAVIAMVNGNDATCKSLRKLSQSRYTRKICSSILRYFQQKMFRFLYIINT